MTTKAMISGQADPNATKAYVDQVWQHNPKISPNSWRVVERLTVGKCAFSGPIESAQHLKALFAAGTNLFMVNAETAENFGAALQENIEAGVIDRRCIVIFAQAGLLYGSTLERWKNETLSEVTRAHDDLWHCMSPAFLEKEFSYIKDKLGVETIDFLTLQDPEYTLAGLNDKEAFYSRLTEAFTFFEEDATNGNSLFYGMCSNTLTMPESDPAGIDLSKVHECALHAAQEAWGRRKRPAFRALALPFNILETSAIHNTNTTAKTFDGDEQVSTLELAARMKLSVFATRPLHAFIPNQGILPLRDAPDHPDLIQQAQKKLYDMLQENLDDGWQSAKLPEIALNAAASVPGISCVMDYFKEENINENIGVYERGDFPDPIKFIENA